MVHELDAQLSESTSCLSRRRSVTARSAGACRSRGPALRAARALADVSTEDIESPSRVLRLTSVAQGSSGWGALVVPAAREDLVDRCGGTRGGLDGDRPASADVGTRGRSIGEGAG